ncbi:MAG: flagellar filament capping protein FliD [Gammaproteobacteria bacterium]|nr:flagellar filament capping protein FliD [Gammaproteobacteria bacterium]
MANITSPGIGSGLDVAGIVQQLVAAEARPVETRLGLQEARAQFKLSAYGNLTASLSEFRDTLDVMRDIDKFLVRQGVSGDESLFTASVSGSAVPASYSIEILQVAQAQKLTSGSFVDQDTAIGTGTLQIGVGANSFDIDVTAGNNTLAGIRDAINAATDNQGVLASIVNADAGSYLILSGDKTGLANTITITQTGGDGGLASLEYDPGNGLNALTESIAAQDALIRIDGLDVASDTNTIAGAIQGITISLAGSAPGQTTSLSVVNDTAAASTTVTKFVESYNQLIETFDQLSNFDAETKVAGPLLGDTTLRNIRDQIRREFSTTVTDLDANFSTLSEIGIELQLDGTLSVDEPQLATVLADDFSKFGQLFATTDGFAVRAFDLVERYLDTDGVLEARTKGLNDQVKGFGEQREALSERLASLETRLLRRFNALDSLLGQLSSTSNFLAQQLDNLPGVTRPGR